MQTILNKLESQNLTFKLGDEQKQVLLQVFSLLNEPGYQEIGIFGSAGTGKTALTRIITKYLDFKNISYHLVAPTHKAKKILSDTVGQDAMTIHQLLKLKPSLDILELDFNDLKFTSSTDIAIWKNGVVILDECSMVNNDLFETLVERCKDKNTKLIVIGDAAQIAPVKQGFNSKTFKVENAFQLKKVYRQQDENPLLDVLLQLRKTPIFEFKEFKSNNGSLKIYNHWKQLLDDTKDLFKESVSTSDPSKVKLFAYTNKRVEAFNKEIRKVIYDSPDEYEVGDLLTGYSAAEYQNGKKFHKIGNSYEYKVINAKRRSKIIEHLPCEGWDLELFDFQNQEYFSIFILSRDNSNDVFETLGVLLELQRIDAINASPASKNTLWKKYYKVANSFLTPKDIYVDNRLIIPKSLDYGYAMTVHKSQSCTIDNILVDMENIQLIKNPKELKQMQYVVLSRTKNNVYMLK